MSLPIQGLEESAEVAGLQLRIKQWEMWLRAFCG